VAFVAVVLGLLGLLGILAFVVMYAKLGALADELRDARAENAHQLGTQLDAIADKLQGMRLDLGRQERSIEALTTQLEGPPSLRRPPLLHQTTSGKEG
jgi:hypothetical protein